jgi:hypothetical protein
MKVLDLKVGLEPRSILGGIVTLVVISGVVAVAPRLIRSIAKLVIKTGIRAHRACTKAPPERGVKGRKSKTAPETHPRLVDLLYAGITENRREVYEQFADFVAAVNSRVDLDKARKGQMIHDRASELGILS